MDLIHHEAYNDEGQAVVMKCKILSFGSRKSDDAYIDYSSGKQYPLEKVLKKRKLQNKLKEGELLQMPAGSDFMVVQEYHDGNEIYKRCCNLDMLATVRNIRIVEP